MTAATGTETISWISEGCEKSKTKGNARLLEFGCRPLESVSRYSSLLAYIRSTIFDKTPDATTKRGEGALQPLDRPFCILREIIRRKTKP